MQAERLAMNSSHTNLDSDIGWQKLLKELQNKVPCHVNENVDGPICGVRVVYYNSSNPSESDHSDLHNEHWKKALTDRPRSLEVGTVTDFDFKDGVVSVLWDCGNKRTYTYNLWKNLTVYSLGPAGYLGQMVFCDKCLDPSKGLAFRLARQNVSVGDLYDLCVQCYNEGDDEHTRSHFHCNIPSGNIDQDDDAYVKKVSLPTREESVQYSLLGIFKCATVDCTSASTSTGEVLNIVHEEGKYDLRKADYYYDSCAEVKLQEDGSLVYWEAGSGGKVELKAIKPGEAPFPVAIEHYIKFGDVIVMEMFTYKTKLEKMEEPVLNCYCFMRYNPPDDRTSCYSLTISGTRLTKITDTTIWKRCKGLKIVILLMNELDSLPAELRDHASTIELVCVQHNKFEIVPPIIYEDLTNIKHLNLHGNQISTFPSELQSLEHLERLKFGHNYLYSLPDIFSSFKCLIEIAFNNNFLTRLPPSFANLTKLESIDLTNNLFTCIPAPLLKLANLKSIYMRFNRIHRLSPLEDIEGKDTHALLVNIVTLSFRGNPVYMQLKPDTTLENVKANFFALDQVPGPTTKALRVLVLGSCGAGKTSIVEAISLDKYVTPTSEMHHDHTVGIDIFSIPVKMTTKYEQDFIVELRLWDFAGERSYVMMNNLFVTDGTLIWIAVNFKTYQCTSCSFQKYLAPWIEQVMTRTARPIVWIIGTHTDKCTAQEIKDKEINIRDRINRECDVFKKTICKELDNVEKSDRSLLCIEKKKKDLTNLKESNVPCFVKSNLKVMCLTNTHGFEGFNSLKTELARTIDSFESLCETLSIDQQKAADNLRQKTEEFLSRGEAPIISKTTALTLIREVLDSQDKLEAENELEAENFLRYLYQIGAVLICKSHSDTTVILDVDWLINLLKQIFHHDFPAMIESKSKSNTFHGLFNSGDVESKVNHQQSTGMVVDELLDALWGLKETTKERLIAFLETMGLAYVTKKSPDPSGCLFPWLVVQKFPGPIPPKILDQDRHILISYEFSPCIPKCFVQELVVKCQRSSNLVVSIDSVYEDAFIIYTTFKSVCFSVHVLEKREPESMCGKVYVLITQVDATEIINTDSLWRVAFKFIGIMQTMLSFWTFYSNLKINIHCTLCSSHCWRLPLKTEPKTPPPRRHTFLCKSCKKIVLADLMAPPDDLMLKEDEYFDNRESPSSAIDNPQTASGSNCMSVVETHVDSKSQIVSLNPPSKSDHYPQQQSHDDSPPSHAEAANLTATAGIEETIDQLEMGTDTETETETTQQNLHVDVDRTELISTVVHQFFEDRNNSRDNC